MMIPEIRVLYVDDEPDLLNIGKMFLEQSGEFTVTTATSAPDAIRLLKQERFDVIVSDYQMPKMDGIRFLVETRTKFGRIPFILLTGKGREDVVIEALNAGADGYLQKGGDPGVQFTELSRKIKQAASRKRVDDALNRSEERFDQLAEQSCTVAWEVDAQGLYTYVSHVSEAVWGYRPDKLVGRMHFYDLHPESGREAFKTAAFAVFEQKEPFRNLENAIQAKDGHVVWVSTTGIPLMNADRTLRGYRGSDTDITERKRAEVAIRQANRKLTLLYSNTRHDINNQLTVLMGYLSLIEMKQPDPTLIEYFKKAATAAERISTMIRFTKEYDSIGFNAPAWQDPRTFVDTAAREAPLGKVMVKNDLPAGAEVFADPLIVKVFYNLMDNAARYGGKITTIRFSLEECEGDPILVCEDDGEGVLAEEKEKIFERGFGKNAGFGLSLSRDILDITSITVRETGEPGKGARFEITVLKGAWRNADVQQKKEL